MVGKKVEVELKNEMVVSGTLQSVDQFLNLKLDDIVVEDVERYPHMLSVKNCFIRGSVIRYVAIPKEAVDVDLLQDSARREASAAAAAAAAATTIRT